MMGNRDKIVNSLCVGFLLSFTILFFGPAYLYYGNILEFPFLFKDIWYLFAITSIFFGVAFSVLLFILKENSHQKLVTLFFAVGVMFWIQGNFIVWKYGVLDGNEINWEKYYLNGIIDTTIWLIIITIFLKKSKFLYRSIIKKVSLMLIIIQGAGLLLTIFMSPAQPTWKNYSIDASNAFNFSQEKNIIILLLDCYQSDIFQEIIDENPELANEFQGFTYFRNALGGFPTTYPSITLLHSGLYYKNEVPIQDFIKESFTSSSLGSYLKDNKYKVELYPFFGPQSVHFDKKYVSNITNNLDKLEYESILTELYQLTLFRYTPHFLKKNFHLTESNVNVYKGNLGDNLQFIKKCNNTMVANQNVNVFKYFHIKGAHPPFNINNKLEYEELKSNREGYIEQAKAVTYLTLNFIDKLKQLGIYDNSMIFIISDHGYSNGNIPVDASNLFVNIMKENSRISDRVIASGIPLILVKPFNSDYNFTVSDVPVTLGDIPKTIAEILGEENNFPGESIFLMNDNYKRIRHFYHYEWTGDGWRKEFLPKMTEYIVDGHSWVPTSWKPTYNEYIPGKKINLKRIQYNLGSKIDFSTQGNSYHFKANGWSSAEEKFTWTTGHFAYIFLPIDTVNSNLALTINLKPFLVEKKLLKQEVNVFVNKIKVGSLTLDKQEWKKVNINIPKEIIDNEEELEISFELLDAVSPQELGISNDSRELGIAVKSLILEKTNNYCELDRKILFKDTLFQNFAYNGWSEPEENFVWSNGESVMLQLPLREDVRSKTINLELECMPFLGSGSIAKQEVNVYANDVFLDKFELETEKFLTRSIQIPQSVIMNSSILNIKFELPNAVSPKELGLSSDARKLGIALKSFIVKENFN